MDMGYYRCPVEGCGAVMESEMVADPEFNRQVESHIATHEAQGGMIEQISAVLHPLLWKSLREIAEECGGVLSGSGWEMCADKLVAEGSAEVMPDDFAPMGKRYRRA